MGNLTFAKGDATAAAGSWQRAIEIDPENVNALANLGLANMHLGKLDNAREELEKAVKMAPSAANYSTLANAMMLQGKYSDAVQTTLKALALNPNDYRAWGNLAGAYQWGGNRDKAQKTYEKAIGLAEAERLKTPDDSILLVALGGYYASIGNADRSLPLIRKAVARSPDDPFVAYRAGEAYEVLGQRDNAIPLIARALALGYDTSEFDRSPELASLRADVAFQVALTKAKQKNVLDTGKKLN
jgi:tetratricopeptide (TPR) repeat protein